MTTIYDENVEWVFSSASAAFDSGDLTDPHTGVIDLHSSAAAAADTGKWKAPAQFDPSQYFSLSLWLKKQGIWSATTSIVSFYWADQNGAQVGNVIDVKDGAYGFSSSNVNYQNVVIPMSDFGIPFGQQAQYLVFTIGTHTTLSFFLDTVTLSAVSTNPCDPANLVNAAKCFFCLTPKQILAVKTYLLCQWEKITECIAPAAPEILSVSVDSTTAITVHWGPTGAVVPTGYIVKWGTSAGNYDLGSHTTDGSTFSYQITGLTGATTYHFAVFAINGAETCISGTSGDTSATTLTPNGLLNNLSHFFKLQEAAAPFADIGSNPTPLTWTNAGQDFSQVAGHVEASAANYDGSNGFNMLGTAGTAAPTDMGGGPLGVTPVTFGIWFKPSNVQPNNARTCIIIGVWDDDTNSAKESWVVALNAADNTKCQMFTRDTGGALHFTALVGNITLNGWNLLLGGWDDSGVAWLSLNGAARVTVAQASINTTVGGAAFNIPNLFTKQRECQMAFESVGIWQRNFSTTDISNVWNGGVGLPYSQFTT